MLVLTRKLMEKLYIGPDVCVTVVRLESGQVRLGIDAPRQVAVVRAELIPEGGSPGPRPIPEAEEVPGPALTPTVPVAARPAPPITIRPAGSLGIGSRRRAPSR